MINRKQLEASDCARMGAAAIAQAQANQWAVTIAICDDGGHLLWMVRLDGAAPVSARSEERRVGKEC